MQNTIEELESELQELLLKIENIAHDVAMGDLDSFEGFTKTQNYNDRIVEIGHLLKEKGIDITQMEN